MENSFSRIDMYDIDSSQRGYKMIGVNAILDEAGLKFLNNKSSGKIINFKSDIISTIDRQPLDSRINHILKRSFDIVFAILIISIILTWLIPVLAILIKLDSKGPVFFLQKRNKKNGKIFTCIKSVQ